MALISLKILNEAGQITAEASGENETALVVSAAYREGDRIRLESSTMDLSVVWQVDDALGPAFVYLTDCVEYKIPFGEKRLCYSPKAFSGDRHYLYARVARQDEVDAYRNLALNVADQTDAAHCYPHASSNSQTRGESVFAPRNTIDGVVANTSHGEWPYGSWGVDIQDDAAMTIDFGRMVAADKVVLYTRSDFPHDNWWKQVTLTFSDGSNIVWPLKKSQLPHVICFEKKLITWIRLEYLILSDDPSPFPALSQIEVYGKALSYI